MRKAPQTPGSPSRNPIVLALLYGCLTIAASVGSAQVFTSNLTGVITDPNNAVVPGATVKISSVGTKDQRQTVSGQEGRYTFSQLLPGSYDVTVEAAGFKSVTKRGISLAANQSGELAFSLQVGDVTQSIDVNDNVVAVDTQTANQAITFNEKVFKELPLNARSPFAFIHSAAGTVAVRTGIQTGVQDSGQARFALNGGRDSSAAMLIDGISPTSADWGFVYSAPNTDSVVEVQVVRNSYDLQYGKSGGGVVSMVTKSGTQDFHGLGFEYLRNSALDANSWEQNRVGLRKTTFQRSQFGGNLGGPIWKRKKLYFFGSYDGDREGIPVTSTLTVATTLQRQGDFSQTFNPNNTLSVIHNPFTTRANPAGAGFIRDPFPGNRIPANLIDPVAAAAVALSPNGNQPGIPITQVNNFYAAGKTVTRQNRVDARIDWVHNEKHTLFARITERRFQQNNLNIFGNFADNGIGVGISSAENVALGNTFVPNPTLVINVLVGESRNWGAQVYPGTGVDGTKVGLPAATVRQFDALVFPQFNIDSYATIGNARVSSAPGDTENLQVNVTKERGTHSLKFGFLAEDGRLNYAGSNSALFSFNRGMTSGPTAATNSTTSGNSVASMLLGTGATGSAPVTTRNATSQMYYAWYFQDTWRINPRITVNYGLRYELQVGRTERYNRMNNFDFTIANPLSTQVSLPLRGGLVFVTPDDRGLWATDKTDFAPRIGISAKITSKLVARLGYGIYYPQTIASVNGSSLAAGGYSTSTDWVASRGGDGLNPQDLLRNPFPNGVNQAVGNAQGLKTLAGQAVDAFQRYHPSGYIQNYSLDLQYEVAKGTVVEVGYSGNQSRKLLYGTARNGNQLPTALLKLGAALDQPVRNPFQGVIASGNLAGATVPANQLLRPYPQYTAVNVSTDTPGSSASYNALVAKVTKQFSGGLFLVSSYQFSKAIDNASETQGWEISEAFRDYYDQRAERSISGHDVPHSWVTSLVYELPVGKGKKFGASMPAVANAVTGGWQLSTTTRLSSGLPLQVTTGNNLATYGFGVQRPNIANLKDLEVSSKTPERWFNTAAFTAPAAFTVGNSPRWFPNLRFDWARGSDFALAKQFRFKERLRAQFRAEFFNITNTPQFGRATTNLASPAFGSIGSGTVAQSGSTINRPRNVQAVLRIEF